MIASRLGRLSGKLSLSFKTLASLIGALAVGLAATTYFISDRSSRTTEEISVESGRNLGDGITASIERDLNTAMKLTEAMRDAFLGLRNQRLNLRVTYLEILKQMMDSNPQLVGVWTAWEPNALDGQDSAFANPDGSANFPGAEAHDATGRFVPYVFKTADGHGITPLLDYDKPGAGDYYLLAQQTGKQQIIEPYPYEVDGKTILLTSLVTPIIVNGSVVGVTGVDLAMSDIQARLSGIKPYETGSVALISHGGMWAAHEQPDYIGKGIDETNATLVEAKARIAKGEEFDLKDYSNSLGTNVLRAFEPVVVGETGTPWSVLVNLPEDKVLAPSRELTWFTVGAAAILVLALSTIVALLIRALVVRPIGGLTKAVEALAGGDTNVTVPATERGDELGVMAKAIEFFRQKLIEVEELRGKNEQAAREAAEARRKGMLDLADSFEASVKGVVQAVSSSAVELEANAQSMSAVAEEATRQSAAVSAAIVQCSANVSTVAAAAEEMSASVNEISRQVAESSGAAHGAVNETEAAAGTVQKLAAAAQEIGDIVRMISDIAGQTNLLALNATIEAARAGDAGKGFAVVASEVKSLANQTGRAAEDITNRIQRIQAATGEAVSAMDGVRSTIAKVESISTAIASAVEEQSAATREISGNAGQAAAGTDEVARNVEGVRAAAGDAGSAANQVLSASGELAKQAEALRQEVDSFIARVRAG